MTAFKIPLSDSADEWLCALAVSTGAAALGRIDGVTLLGERAMLSGFRIGGRISAGGGCRLYDTRGPAIALNLARSDDRDLLPALLAIENPPGDEAVETLIAQADAEMLVARGRLMGMAIASEEEKLPVPLRPCMTLVEGIPSALPPGRKPRVLDLSALWAGPLAAHLLWLAGADVVKVESRKRPDAMRNGDPQFHALLNQGKASVLLDFTDIDDRRALLSLIAGSDIVIEAARPRALLQLGIDASAMVRATPGLVWISITAHGAEGDAANWVGFGDDCGVAAGLSEALRKAGGRRGFVGDAIADPLTGLFAARLAWEAHAARRGGRYGLAMSHVAATALAESHQRQGGAALEQELRQWAAAEGRPFPAVQYRPSGIVAAPGADNRSLLAETPPC